MTERNSQERIVITGYGAVSSIGRDAKSTYEAMLRGDRGIENEREWLLENTPASYHHRLRSHLAARVQDFDLLRELPELEPHFDKRNIERYLSRSAQLAMIASAEALRHAGVVTDDLVLEAVDPERFAFVVGTGIGGGIEIGNYRGFMDEGNNIPPTGMNKAQPDNATVMMAKVYSAKGPSSTITAACASGNFAIADAARKLKLGEADLIAAGGAEGVDFQIISTFERTTAASFSDNPDEASRPFDAKPGKAVLSEGAAFLVLELEEHAKKRGAAILGVISGYAETNDASDPTLLTGEGVINSMKLSLKHAGITPEARLFLNTHATATPKGDDGERDAITEVFNGEYYQPEQIGHSVLSMKGFTAHSVGAVNAVEAVVNVQVLNEGLIPPASFIEEDLPGTEDMNPDKSQPTRIELDAVLSNGMGFGGQNASIVIEKYEKAA